MYMNVRWTPFPRMVERNKSETRLERNNPANLCERNECFVGREAGGEESSVRWKCSYCGPVESFGRIWFLETLLPSGRKHRALDYERALTRFLRTLRFAPRKLFEDSWWEDSLLFRWYIFCSQWDIFYLANREIRARMWQKCQLPHTGIN